MVVEVVADLEVAGGRVAAATSSTAGAGAAGIGDGFIQFGDGVDAHAVEAVAHQLADGGEFGDRNEISHPEDRL